MKYEGERGLKEKEMRINEVGKDRGRRKHLEIVEEVSISLLLEARKGAKKI